MYRKRNEGNELEKKLTVIWKARRTEEKRHIADLASLCKWITEHDLREITKREDLLSVIKDRKLSRAIITNVPKGHGT